MSNFNLYSATITPMKAGLINLEKILEKAYQHAATKATKWHDADHQMQALLQDRLVFDQFPLVKQIQILSDNAKGAASRLAQIEVPKFPDTEITYAEVQARIAATIKILDQIQPEQMVNNEELAITLPFFPDQYFTGYEYATEFLLPNFYFHLATAYAIIRKNGVPIGKSDFLGQLSLKNKS